MSVSRRSGILILAAGVASFFGCATGVPTGARQSELAASYPSFSRPASPRAIPSSPKDESLDWAAAVKVQQKQGSKRSLHMSRDLAVDARERVVAIARARIGRKGGSDCSAFVNDVFNHVGLKLLSESKAGDNAVTSIYRFAQRHGRVFHGGWPMPGDLVFFRDTYDQNRDGRTNDGLTHVGIVENVEGDGTALVIHRVARGVVRYRMNLNHRDVRADSSGRILNDQLRHPGPGRREVLTGQLFSAYATVLPVGSALAVR